MNPSKTPTETYLPTFDETKLGKTKFRQYADAYAEVKAKIAELESAAQEYKDQMSALMLKHQVEACRIDGWTARWVKGGVRRTLVPQLLLQAGVKASVLEKGYKVVQAADYFGIYPPKAAREERV